MLTLLFSISIGIRLKCSYEQIRHNYNNYLLNKKTYSLLEMITPLSILKMAILYYNFDSEFTKVSLIKILFCFRIYTRAIRKVTAHCTLLWRGGGSVHTLVRMNVEGQSATNCGIGKVLCFCLLIFYVLAK